MERSKIDVPERTIADFCRRWRIAELALFGSVLGEEFGPDSDVDVLVTFASDAHLSSFDHSDERGIADNLWAGSRPCRKGRSAQPLPAQDHPEQLGSYLCVLKTVIWPCCGTCGRKLAK